MTGILHAEVIHIPEDYETIQAGIDAAENGDTVLVEPGEYVENINFSGKAISVIGNPDDPSEVIIDGNANGSVVVFENEETAESILTGFTIRNGSGDVSGGGIDISRSDPMISNCIIEDNVGYARGGGISISSSNPVIENCIISTNSANVGAGIYCLSSEPIIRDCIIMFNEASQNGGGLKLNLGSPLVIGCEIRDNSSRSGGAIRMNSGEIYISNCTIVNNISRDDEGVIYIVHRDAVPIIKNSILWGNVPGNIYGPAEINWSNFEGGWVDGEGNIDENPQFVDADNNDYNLAADSPCIDSGDPEFPYESDSTRIDMGAHTYYQYGSLNGYVFDLQTEEPLRDVLITTTFGNAVFTDEEGFWAIFPIGLIPFNITAKKIEFIDTTLVDLEIDFEDTLSITFNLLHAELEPSIEDIETTVGIGESEQFDFTISNSGNGVLSWSVETGYRGDVGINPWELRQSFHLGQQLENNLLYGVAFIDSTYFVVGANRGYPTVYVIDFDGALIDTFAQPEDGNRGMKDLAYDGELIWGVIGSTVYGMTLEGEVATSFDAPNNQSTAIAWDSDRELLWVSSITSNPVGIDRDGNMPEGMEVERGELRIYGLAYYPDDADDAPLYIFHRDIETDRQTLVKYNFETREMIFVTYLEPEAGGSPKGAFITDQFDVYNWTFMSISDNNYDDRLDIWQLAANTSWAILDPIEGMINPAAEQNISFTIDATDLLPIVYPAELIFKHNGFGSETIIPIYLTVTPLGVDIREENMLPLQFAITDIFPNPFNSTVRLNYSIPKTSTVSIKLYDLTGSLVDSVYDRLQHVGQHSVTWNASSMPSGIYFARMEAGDFSQTVKLMLMK